MYVYYEGSVPLMYVFKCRFCILAALDWLIFKVSYIEKQEEFNILEQYGRPYCLNFPALRLSGLLWLRNEHNIQYCSLVIISYPEHLLQDILQYCVKLCIVYSVTGAEEINMFLYLYFYLYHIFLFFYNIMFRNESFHSYILLTSLQSA